MLSILRYSQLIALAALVAVVIALTLLYRGLVVDSLVQSETDANVAFTKTFANALWPRHARFVLDASALPRATLPTRPEIAAIEDELRPLAAGLSVVKVKIYDLNGLTVFSTDSRQIGEDKSTNPGFRRARDGYAASEITFRDRFDAWEGELAERSIIASYVPIHRHEAEPVEGVFEVYRDVTELVARIERDQRRIIGSVLGAMALAWLVVQLLLSHYERRLAQGERERKAQEESMRHQAFHDTVTSLPNRASFTVQLREALARAKRSGSPLALLFLDLDLFKRVNDSLGHDAAIGFCASPPSASVPRCARAILCFAWAATSSPCCSRICVDPKRPAGWRSAYWTRSPSRCSSGTMSSSLPRASESRFSPAMMWWGSAL
jgi:Diguanylate cyclase, GGDEF domain